MILLNNAQARSYNMPKERALGTTPYDIYPRDVADKLVAWDKKVLTEGKSVRFEETVPLGKVPHTFATNKFPLRDSNGKIYGLGAVVTDITERKKDENALRTSEERLKMAQRIAHFGSWEFNIGENKALWSEELFQIFGLEPQQYGPNLETYRKYIHPDDAELVRESMDKFLAEGRIGDRINFDYRIILTNGSVCFLHSERMITDVDDAGKPCKIMGIEQDITDRQLVEHQLQHYRKNLEALVEERTRQLKDAERLAAIGQTAGMVGHDIRNPLQAILSDVYLLKFDLTAMPQSATKEEVAESLGSIEENIGYINKIVADLQDYARPLNPDYSEVGLSDLVAGVFQNLIIPENINLSIDIKAFKRLNTDPTFIRRALTNLVNNAIQAMSGGGKLEVSGFEKEDKVYITVSDTGPGIPKEIKAKLFTPMVTTKAKGQGLGLAVVKRLIEALEGTIIFESEEDKGTKFIIELPMSLRR
jgi:signal transduction histidine kinase